MAALMARWSTAGAGDGVCSRAMPKTSCRKCFGAWPGGSTAFAGLALPGVSAAGCGPLPRIRQTPIVPSARRPQVIGGTDLASSAGGNPGAVSGRLDQRGGQR